MRAHAPQLVLAVLVLATGLYLDVAIRGQETQPAPSPAPPPAPAAAADLPPVPKGVEVQARGPVHEAFATPTTEPVPTKPVAKAPPKALEEMPPDEKPEGNVLWIGGYWAWDDERNDFLWVSGTWRTPPPGKRWVAGYWKEDGAQWLWVPGFWAAAENQEAAGQHQVTYLPAPPAPPETAAPGQAPAADSFYVPGHWVYHEAGYLSAGGSQVWRDAGFSWSSGYWARVQPGYVWVPGHYRWTPSGYLYIPGYWDLTVANRGILYAPVVVDYAVVGPTFVYTPAYAVHDTILIDAMFVRPCYCHYYFGDYYGVAYRNYGYESVVVYSSRHYDPIFVYARYEHRYEPAWERTTIEINLARHEGRAPLPPRTLVQQNVIIQNNVTNNYIVNNNRTTVNNQVLMPSSRLAAAKGVRTVPLDQASRVQAQQQAQAIQQVAAQRNRAEVPVPAGRPIQPHTAALNVPAQQPATSRLAAASGARPATNTYNPTGAAPSAHPTQPGGATLSGRPGQPALGTTARPPAPGTTPRPGTQPQRTLQNYYPRMPQRPAPSRPEPPNKRPPGGDPKGG